jgi:type I restriction enzyme S subunit
MQVAENTVPKGWVIATVGQVGLIRLGRQRSPKKVTGRDATKYLRPANITASGELALSDVLEMDFTPKERVIYSLKSDDVLLVDSSGSPTQVGRAAIWKGELGQCCYQNHLIRFRAHAVLPEYALLVFRHMSASGVFADAARGIGIQHLGATRLAEMAFPLPPLNEQRRIAEEARRRLEDLAAAQGALTSALSRLVEQDRLILESAVTGVLVESEAELASRENRSFEPASALLARFQPDKKRSLFSDQDTSPPVMTAASTPSGWAAATIGDVGDVRLGRQRAPEYERGDHPTPYLRAANITIDGLDLTDVFHMDFTPNERRVYELYSGDVVLSEASGSSAHVGRPAIWRGEIPGCCFQNTVIRFRPFAASSDYAFLLFRYLAESGAFGRAARGVAIQHLGASRFATMPFPLPPTAEQDRIVAEAERRLADSRAQRGAVQASLARFGTLRREVWAAAVNGQLATQDPEDEPATTLLNRLGPPVEPTRSLPGLTKKEDTVTKSPRRRARGAEKIKPLRSALADTDRPVSLPDLFVSAGYDRDSAGDVERFYLALRDEVGGTIVPVGDVEENAVLELRDAS